MFITVEELTRNIEVQVAIHCYYYDEEKEERVEISNDEAMDKAITFMYCEDNELCLEVDMEN